jgi:hypothetical protein
MQWFSRSAARHNDGLAAANGPLAFQSRSDHSSAMNRFALFVFVLLGTIQPSPAAKIVPVAGGGRRRRMRRRLSASCANRLRSSFRLRVKC